MDRRQTLWAASSADQQRIKCRFGVLFRSVGLTTLLMSTGLTFGSISALYSLTNGIIDQSYYTILVTLVVGWPSCPPFSLTDRSIKHLTTD
jgi:hypothetical protein